MMLIEPHVAGVIHILGLKDSHLNDIGAMTTNATRALRFCFAVLPFQILTRSTTNAVIDHFAQTFPHLHPGPAMAQVRTRPTTPDDTVSPLARQHQNGSLPSPPPTIATRRFQNTVPEPALDRDHDSGLPSPLPGKAIVVENPSPLCSPTRPLAPEVTRAMPHGSSKASGMTEIDMEQARSPAAVQQGSSTSTAPGKMSFSVPLTFVHARPSKPSAVAPMAEQQADMALPTEVQEHATATRPPIISPVREGGDAPSEPSLVVETGEQQGDKAVADEGPATPIAEKEAPAASTRSSTISPIPESGNMLSESPTDVEMAEQRDDSTVTEEHSSTSSIAAKTPLAQTRPSTLPPVSEGRIIRSESLAVVEMEQQHDSTASLGDSSTSVAAAKTPEAPTRPPSSAPLPDGGNVLPESTATAKVATKQEDLASEEEIMDIPGPVEEKHPTPTRPSSIMPDVNALLDQHEQDEDFSRLVHGFINKIAPKAQNEDHQNPKKRASSASIAGMRKKTRTTANLPRNGLSAYVLVLRLTKILLLRKTKVERYSPVAKVMGIAERFVPAMAQTLMNAFSIARNNDLTEFMRNFSWTRHCAMNVETFQNPVGIDWQKNLHHLKLSMDNQQSSSINFRFLEYQQKFHVDAEVTRRVSQTNVTDKTARRNAIEDVARTLGLGASDKNKDKYKAMTGLRNLFKINEKLNAFLCSRPKDDKWKAILHNDHGNITESHIVEWTDLVGVLCEEIWLMQTILR
jgi:hypothetical protein